MGAYSKPLKMPHLLSSAIDFPKQKLQANYIIKSYAIILISCMQFHGKRITWQFVEDLYYHTKTSVGLSTVYKLKHEHVYLTSFSKMRVDLAAQVYTCTFCYFHRCKCLAHVCGFYFGNYWCFYLGS